MNNLITEALIIFDEINSKDPNKILVDGQEVSFELAFSNRLSSWINRLSSSPSDALLLASRCQHIERWTIARGSYPTGKTGYLNWRSDLAKFHAKRSAQILTDLGLEEELIEEVRTINQKKAIKLNADAQIMEDALCLEFLDFQLEKFAQKYEDQKIVTILKKSWKKMSGNGRKHALDISYPEHILVLIQQAIN